jgi:hypothetical protein
LSTPILVDHARSRDAIKRGGGLAVMTLDEAAAIADTQAAELLALNDALVQLAFGISWWAGLVHTSK